MKSNKYEKLETDILRGNFLESDEMFLLSYLKDFDRRKSKEMDKYFEDGELDFGFEQES